MAATSGLASTTTEWCSTAGGSCTTFNAAASIDSTPRAMSSKAASTILLKAPSAGATEAASGYETT